MHNSTNPHNSSLGLPANVLAMLAYLATFIISNIPIIKYVAWFAPLIIFFIERESGFVRYHALQAFLINIVSTVLGILSGLFGVSMGFGLIFGGLLGLVGGAMIFAVVIAVLYIAIFVYQVISLIKAYKYAAYRIPVIGGIAANITGF